MNLQDGSDSSASFIIGEGKAGAGVRTILLCALLCAAALLAYSGTFEVPFLFDDVAAIERNPNVQITRLTPAQIGRVLDDPPYYGNRPVAMVSFALNHIAGGLDVRGYHAVNMLIHLVAAIVLFFLFRATLRIAGTGRSSPDLVAFAAALLWTVHPLQTQSVTYILQRMNSLASLFFFLSMLLYVRGRTAGAGRAPWLYWLGALTAGALALGSKETAVSLPLIILLYEFIFFRGFDLSWVWRRWPVILGFGLFALFILFRYQGPDPWETIVEKYEIRNFTLEERLLTELRVLLFYLRLLILPLPSQLNIDHDFPLSSSMLDPPTTLLSAFVIAVLIFGALLYGRRRPLFSFAILWYFGTLALESSFIGLEIIFEHRVYLPSAFPMLAAVCAVDELVPARRFKVFLLAAAAVMLAVWTYQRNAAWKDDVTFWRDAASKSPAKARPHNNLGEALVGRGELIEAEEHFRKALKADQEYLAARINLGNALAIQGDHDRAISHYRRALKALKDNPEILINLGNALAASGRIDEAIQEYGTALQLDPDSIPARRSLALLLAGRGEFESALTHFVILADRRPGDPSNRYNLGLTLARTGRIREAITHFEAALAINPGMEDARANLDTARKLLLKGRGPSGPGREAP
ncbi:tetratricopeptide repeat protein [Candidatus Moduliflexota bacterium]